MSDILPPPTSKNVPDALWCHRFFIPVPYAEQTMNPITKQPIIEPKGNLVFMKCLGEQCALWVKAHKKCGDLLNAEATQGLLDQKLKEYNTVKFVESGH